MVLDIARVFIGLGIILTVTGHVRYCIFAYGIATVLLFCFFIKDFFIKDRFMGKKSNEEN